MIDIGVASPSAQGQAMISTDDRVEHRVRPRRLRAEQSPDQERRDRRRQHRQHEPEGHRDRPCAASARASAAPAPPAARSARAPCRAADLVGAHHQAAGAVERRADRPVAPVALARPASARRSASTRRRWNGPRAPCRRPAPSRRAARAGGRRRARAASGTSSSLPSSRSRRAVFGARPSSAGSPPRSASVRAAPAAGRAGSATRSPRRPRSTRRRGRARGTTPGTVRGASGRDHAVAEGRAPRRCRSASTCWGCAGAIDCTQRTKNGQPAHSTTGAVSTSSSQVRVAVGSHASSRWPNIASASTATVSGSVHQKRRLKSRSSGLSSSSERRHFRLQRHAADRAACPGVVLADLRVHRAGVDRRRRAIRGGRRWRRAGRIGRGQIGPGAGDKARPAAFGAEVIGLARMFGSVRAGERVDRHAAHRVARRRRRSAAVRVVVLACVWLAAGRPGRGCRARRSRERLDRGGGAWRTSWQGPGRSHHSRAHRG